MDDRWIVAVLTELGGGLKRRMIDAIHFKAHRMVVLLPKMGLFPVI